MTPKVGTVSEGFVVDFDGDIVEFEDVRDGFTERGFVRENGEAADGIFNA